MLLRVLLYMQINMGERDEWLVLVFVVQGSSARSRAVICTVQVIEFGLRSTPLHARWVRGM